MDPSLDNIYQLSTAVYLLHHLTLQHGAQLHVSPHDLGDTVDVRLAAAVNARVVHVVPDRGLDRDRTCKDHHKNQDQKAARIVKFYEVRLTALVLSPHLGGRVGQDGTWQGRAACSRAHSREGSWAAARGQGPRT